MSSYSDVVIHNKAQAGNWLLASVCLYSFGHWVGGTIALVMGLYLAS